MSPRPPGSCSSASRRRCSPPACRRTGLPSPGDAASRRRIASIPTRAPDSFADQGWWEIYQDPVLADLLSEALANNLDVRIAATRVEAARAILGATRMQQLPQASRSARAQRGRAPRSTSYPGDDRRSATSSRCRATSPTRSTSGASIAAPGSRARAAARHSSTRARTSSRASSRASPPPTSRCRRSMSSSPSRDARWRRAASSCS